MKRKIIYEKVSLFLYKSDTLQVKTKRNSFRRHSRPIKNPILSGVYALK